MPIKVLDSETSMCTLTDFNDLFEGRTKAVGSMAQDYVRQASQRDSWSDDPGQGAVPERLRGDFKYAVELMKTINVGAVAGNITSLAPDFEFGLLEGTEVNMDQYLRHEPRCMGRIVMPEAADGERIIRVAVGVGGNCGTSSEELVKRAAIVLKVIQEYSDAGYGVEVFAFSAGSIDHDGRGRLFTAIVDCSRSATGQIISAMASTKVFRTLIFAALSEIPNAPGYLGYPINHKQAAHAIPRVHEQLKKHLGKNIKIIAAGASEEQVREALK